MVTPAGDTADASRTATPDSYFEQVWSTGDDPWEHGSRWYEARKYALTVAALPRPRYRRAFEPGCGGGFLTVALAPRVAAILAMERSGRGVDVTRRRCARLPGVEVRPGRIPGDWPDGRFDLVVLSELLYYLDDGDLDEVLRRTTGCLDDGGHVVAVHYRRPVAEHARSGDDVHDALRATFGEPIVTYREPDFALDVFGPAPAPADGGRLPEPG